MAPRPSGWCPRLPGRVLEEELAWPWKETDLGEQIVGATCQDLEGIWSDGQWAEQLSGSKYCQAVSDMLGPTYTGNNLDESQKHHLRRKLPNTRVHAM